MDGLTWVLLIGLVLWAAVGWLMLNMGARGPKPGQSSLVRTADRRVMLVGERVNVSLHCSAIDAPVTESDQEAWNIALLIDHSGSMGNGLGSALAQAQHAATNLVRTTPDNFKFAVIGFHSAARLVTPLTTNRRTTARAIKSLSARGGTDIASALKLTLDVLPRENQLPQAVLLLSDGGSAVAPAVAAATTLKQRGVKLITIAVEGADKDTLRQIATDENHCYEAASARELGELYTQIGQDMAGATLSGVTATERFDSKRFGVREWGDIRPVTTSLGDGQAQWLLSVLEQRTVRLSYWLEAHCAGWHRLGTTAATLEGLTEDGQSIRMTSNVGPRVLVLPRMAGWQLFQFVFNPLFFTMFGRYFCRAEAYVPFQESEPPTPSKLQLPPPLVSGGDRSQSITPIPSLVIGLGFSGIHAITQCKRLVWEQNDDELASKYRFLGLDMASQDYFPSPTLGGTRLTSSERVDLRGYLQPIIEAEAGLTTDRRFDWLPARTLLAGGSRPDLHRGTGNIRALGRLSLIQAYDQVKTAIRTQLNAILEGSSGSSKVVSVLVTGSTGGGFASGVLLDVCWLVRCVLDELQLDGSGVSVLLITPHCITPINQEPNEAPLRNRNHHALVAEIGRVAASQAMPLAPTTNATRKTAWFDRLFFIGDVDNARPVKPGLFEAGEMLWCWLSCAQWRQTFTDLDAKVSSLAQTSGAAICHRLSARSSLLFTRSLSALLACETLYSVMKSGLDSSKAEGSENSALIAGVTTALLGDTAQNNQRPWALRYLNDAQEISTLADLIQVGGGPMTASGMEVERFVVEQRKLLRSSLAISICDVLNGETDSKYRGMIGPVLAGIATIGEQLRVAQHTAQTLGEQSREKNHTLLLGESPIIEQLMAHGRSVAKGWHDELQRWADVLGEGQVVETSATPLDVEIEGVLGRVRRLASELDTELEACRTNETPRFPLDANQVSALKDEYHDKHSGELRARLHWHAKRTGSLPELNLTISAKEAQEFSLRSSEPPALAKQITAALYDLALAVEGDSENTLLSNVGFDAPVPTQPRAELSGREERALYLSQGVPSFDPSRFDVTHLDPISSHEQRIVAAELNRSLDQVAVFPANGELPFVFDEEHFAYQAYHFFCQATGTVSQNLSPTIVAAFAYRPAILDFVWRGLYGGAITEQQRDGQRVWVAKIDSATDVLQAFDSDLQQGFVTAVQRWAQWRGNTFSSNDLAALKHEMDAVSINEIHATVLGATVLSPMDPTLRAEAAQVFSGLLKSTASR